MRRPVPQAIAGWWFRPEPIARFAVLRTLIYLFVICDVLAITTVVVPQSASPALYDPVRLLELVQQPAPDQLFTKTLRVVIVLAAAVAATGRFRRLAGWTVAVTYIDWSCLDMSYGKVDHDHLAIMVAVLVLPTVSGATWRSSERGDAAGFALRCIEVAAVATYFLSAYAKMRFGGAHWPLGAIFAWAILRRGTGLATPLLHHPHVLFIAQWGLILMEASTPLLLFVRQRWRTLGVLGLFTFHLTTYLMIRISFLPLVACLFAFLPLERFAAMVSRSSGRPHPSAEPAPELAG